MSEPRVIVCRHGNTFGPGDTVTRVGGRTDLPLVESGRAQAAALAAHFAGTVFTRTYTSDLLRTRETLRAIAPDREPTVLPFLREIDYGPDENRPESEVVARVGEAAIAAWDARGALPDGWKLDVEALRRDWAAFMAARAAEGGTHLVMTSNGVARFVFSALELPTDGLSIKLRTGAYGALIYRNGAWAANEWNVRPNP